MQPQQQAAIQVVNISSGSSRGSTSGVGPIEHAPGSANGSPTFPTGPYPTFFDRSSAPSSPFQHIGQSMPAVSATSRAPSSVPAIDPSGGLGDWDSSYDITSETMPPEMQGNRGTSQAKKIKQENEESLLSGIETDPFGAEARAGKDCFWQSFVNFFRWLYFRNLWVLLIDRSLASIIYCYICFVPCFLDRFSSS